MRKKHPCLLVVLVGLVLNVSAQVTESPHPVAPGKLLLEMDGLKLSFDREGPAGNKYSAVGVASAILTAGLTSTVDLQVGFDLFHREVYEYRGGRDSHSGMGDLSFRAKWKFWEDTAWGAAAAMIPYVRVPTNKDGIGTKSVEGGFIVPWSMGLGAGFIAGAMLQWDMIRNDADNGYDTRWYLSGLMRRDLAAGFSVYAETTLEAFSTGGSNWNGSVGVGGLWRWSERLQLDYELLRGLNRGASEWTHVLRVNWGW